MLMAQGCSLPPMTEPAHAPRKIELWSELKLQERTELLLLCASQQNRRAAMI